MFVGLMLSKFIHIYCCEDETALWRFWSARALPPEILHQPQVNPHTARALQLQSGGGRPLACISRQPGSTA